MAEDFWPYVFGNVGGISGIRKTPSRLKHEYPFHARLNLAVYLPGLEQLSGSHPFLTERLESDWGKGLSSLKCSSGDFRQALQSGLVNLGHVWAEIFSLCLDRISLHLGFGRVLFHEKVRFSSALRGDCGTKYRIDLFFSVSNPRELLALENLVTSGRLNAIIGGLEYLVTGYLNAAINGYWFPIHKRLKEFVRYRGAVETSQDHSVSTRTRRKGKLIRGRRN